MGDSLLAGFPVVIEWPIAWGEMDAFGHVNNINYFRWFENARIEYLRRVGWEEIQAQTGVGIILAAVEARFRKPLTYPDSVQLAVRVSSLAEDRFIMEHRVVSRRLGALVAEGKGTVVTFDYTRQQKAPIPEEMRQRITALEKGSGVFL